MSFAKLRCFFDLHKYEYFAGYYRKCAECNEVRPGWGLKHLNPGDRWLILRSLSVDTKVNPDDFRDKKDII